ncbi:hypothetical protein AB1Y20_022950 [Prymnesium parvum]|uniref:Uncharacterized protein n=1 Tax=Prymnesium parvum TaxID=97485 RepID=A0AB34JF80_PRYPA
MRGALWCRQRARLNSLCSSAVYTHGACTETAPWLGLTEKLDSAGKEIISHYKHSLLSEENVVAGEVVKQWKIKYVTEYEPSHKARIMSKNTFNVTRLGDYLLTSSCTPEHVKEKVARMMRSKTAKTFVEELNTKRKASLEQVESVTLSRKAVKAVKHIPSAAERAADLEEIAIIKELYGSRGRATLSSSGTKLEKLEAEYNDPRDDTCIKAFVRLIQEVASARANCE